MKRRAALLLFALALAASSGCARPPMSPADRASAALAEARARWQRAGLRDYDFDFDQGGFTPFSRVRVSVRAGVVSGVESIPPGMPTGKLASYQTVDALFDEVARAEPGDDDVGKLRDATFDPKLGFPMSATFTNVSELWNFHVRALTAR
jgi:hypothetical protein